MIIKVQYIILLLSFYCVIDAVSATEPNYFVVFPTLSLYEKIPKEASQSLLNNTPYQPTARVLAALKEGDIVRIKPRDKGRYQDALCQKDSSKKMQYDWLEMRDWLCVEVVSAIDQADQGKTGWLHRLGTVAILSINTQTRLTFYVQDFRPFTVCQAGRPAAGVGVEIVKSVCDAMGEKVQCDILCTEDWDKAQKELSKEKNAGLFFISRDVQRDKDYFLSPVVRTTYSFFTLAGNPWRYTGNTSSLSELLKNRKLDAYGPSGTYTYFGQLAQVSLPPPRYRTTDAALEGLKKGEIEVLYSNAEVAEFHAKAKSLGIQYAGSDREIDYYIGLSKATPKTIATWFRHTMIAKKIEIDQILHQNGLQPITQ